MFYAPHTIPGVEEFILEMRRAEEFEWNAALMRARSQPILQRDPKYRNISSSKLVREEHSWGTDYLTRECERFFGR